MGTHILTFEKTGESARNPGGLPTASRSVIQRDLVIVTLTSTMPFSTPQLRYVGYVSKWVTPSPALDHLMFPRSSKSSLQQKRYPHFEANPDMWMLVGKLKHMWYKKQSDNDLRSMQFRSRSEIVYIYI